MEKISTTVTKPIISSEVMYSWDEI